MNYGLTEIQRSIFVRHILNWLCEAESVFQARPAPRNPQLRRLAVICPAVLLSCCPTTLDTLPIVQIRGASFILEWLISGA